jgi:hypothetical protein
VPEVWGDEFGAEGGTNAVTKLNYCALDTCNRIQTSEYNYIVFNNNQGKYPKEKKWVRKKMMCKKLVEMRKLDISFQ